MILTYNYYNITGFIAGGKCHTYYSKPHDKKAYDKYVSTLLNILKWRFAVYCFETGIREGGRDERA